MKYSLYLFFTFSFIFTQNYSLSFDGIDDYIEIENPDIVFHVNQGLTIKAEVLSEPGASGYLINRYQHGAGNTPNNNFFILYNHPEPDTNIDCNLCLAGRGTGGACFEVTGFDCNSSNTFYIVFGDSNYNTKVYLNNDNSLELIGQTNRDVCDNPSNFPLLIGKMHDDDGSDDMGYLEGVISELKTWDKALTQNEIENIEDQDEFLSSDFQFSLNENNILYDASTNANHGTIYGASWIENIYGCTDELAGNYNDGANMDDGSCTNYPDNGEYSLSFDGSDDNVEISTFDNLQLDNVSFGMWVKKDWDIVSQSSSAPVGYIYNFGDLRVAHDENGILCHAGLCDFNISENNQFDNNWIYLTFISGQEGRKLYVNGNQVANDSHIQDYYSFLENNFIASYNSTDSRYLDVDIKEFSIWSREINQEEIIGYISDEAFIEDHLIVHYKFNAGQGNILYDHSGNQNHGTINGATWVNMEGCTDELAGNYNDEANMDDGSCEYDEISEMFAYLGGEDDVIAFSDDLSFEDAEGFSVSYFISDDFYTSRIETHLDLFGENQRYLINSEYGVLKAWYEGNDFAGVSNIAEYDMSGGEYTDTWIHITVTYGPLSTKIYVNGELKDASQNSYSGPFYLEPGYDKYFAAATTSDEQSVSGGNLDDITFWTKELSEDEVQNLMFSFIDYNQNLLGYWSFNDASDADIIDFSGNRNHSVDAGTLDFVEHNDYPLFTESIADIDGNSYEVIQIGNQRWLKEDLHVTHYKNGDPLNHIENNPDFNHNNHDWNYNTQNGEGSYIQQEYGYLYNVEAAIDERGVCPEGWKVSSDDDWKKLEIYLGISEEDVDIVNEWRGTDEGGKLKSEGTEYWSSPNLGATNSSGFSAKANGWYQGNGAGHNDLNLSGRFWTPSKDANWSRRLDYSNSQILRLEEYPYDGLSIRCIESVEGCTDSYANNYNESANFDDDSCEYPDNGDYSLNFDGVSDYVDIPNSSSLDINGEELSILVKMKVNGSPSGGGNANHTALISKTNTTPPYGGYGIISNEVNNVWMLQLASSSNNSWYGVNAESEFQIGEYETLVGTFNGESGSTKIYINGLLNNETNTFTGNIRSVGDNVEIGRNPQDSPNNECYYNGEISELVVFSREIGSDEVLLFDEGELVYTNNLVAHYKFNAGEGNVLYDHSGNQNHGTIYGAEWTENIYGCTDQLACNTTEAANIDDGSCEYSCYDNGDYSLSFDGQDDYVEIAHSTSFNNISSHTISAKLKLYENPNSRQNILIFGAEATGAHHWILEDNGYMHIGYYNANTSGCAQCNADIDMSPYFGEWIDLAMSYNQENSTMDIYLNGEFIQTINQPVFNLNNSLRLGDSDQGSQFSRFIIEKLKVHDDYLNIEQLESANYTPLFDYRINSLGSYLIDISGNQNHGTINGGATWIENIYGCTDELADNYNEDADFDDGTCEYPDNGDYSLSFDGQDDYVIVDKEVLSGSFTISAWIHPNINDDNHRAIYADYSDQLEIWFGYGFNGKLRLHVGGLNYLDSPYNIIEYNTWNHIVGVWDGSEARIYSNGNLVISGNPNLDNPEPHTFNLGARMNNNSNHAFGYLNKIELFNYALLEEEIYSLSDFNYSSSSSSSSYKFNAGSGIIAYDHSGNQNHGTISGAEWIIPGCTDPLANNYNPAADTDDGSCEGSLVNYQDFTYAGELDGHYYYLSNYTENWDEAKLICENSGGHLVTIQSAEENEFITSIIPEYGWLGLYQNIDSEEYSEPSGGWEWVTGEDLDYTNWNPYHPEPNDGPDCACENFGSIYGYQYHIDEDIGTWNDTNEVMYHILLEMEPGCTDESACNYQPYAYEDDGSCFYAQDDCHDCPSFAGANDGECGGINNCEIDCLGDCDGNAIGPTVSVSEEELSYDIVISEGAQESQTFTITNNGDCELEVSLGSNNQENWALNFDGIDDYASLANNMGEVAEISLSAWVNFPENTNNSNGNIIGNWASAESAYLLRYDTYQGNHTIACNLIGTNGSSGISFPLEDDDFNNWIYITFTYNGSSLKLYKNGELYSEVNDSIGLVESGSSIITIGCEENLGFAGYYNGKMDEVSIWSKELSLLEIQENMASQLGGDEEGLAGYWDFNTGEGDTIFDYSFNQNHGTIYGADWQLLEEQSIPDWLTCNLSETSISAGESLDIECMADADGMDAGSYEGEISLVTNDFENSSISMPVSLNVGKPTFMSDIPSGDFEELEFNTSSEVSISISNSGNMPLTVDTSELSEPLTISENLVLAEGEEGNITIYMSCGVDEVGVDQVLMLTTNDPYLEPIEIPISGACVPTESPIILSSQDVPDDQGGYVVLEFTRSYFDDDGFRPSEYYTVERFEDFGTGTADWVGIFSQAAYADERYSIVVPTGSPIDSPEVSAEFRVVAAMDEGAYESNSIEGTSIDNLNPHVPEDINGAHNDQSITLHWSYDEDPDFLNHQVESLCEDNYTIENFFNDEVTSNEQYQIHSGDFSGNRSSSKNVMVKWLNSGNNLISFSVIPDDPCDLENIFSDVCASAIIGEGVAASKLPNGIWVGSLSCIEPSKGYWLSLDCSDMLFVEGDDIDAYEESLDLHFGLNLIGYPYSYDGESISGSLPDDFEESFESIIGEGVAASLLPNGMWVGSLSKFKATDGYWVKIDSSISSFYFDGCDGRECSNTCDDFIADGRQEDNTDLAGYEYNQSMNQAFYFFESIELDNIELTSQDYILAFYNNQVVGYRQYSGEYTDVPVMGIDGTEFTTGYIEPGIIPMFKILRQDGTLIDLLGGFPAWQNNETFIVSGGDYYSTIPVEFVLDNIYPNPFNPSTNISFAVPIDAHVEISIYDINGRLVKSLVNNVLSAGYYEIEWNASNESSGVYILKMQSEGFVDNQKMMLIK